MKLKILTLYRQILLLILGFIILGLSSCRKTTQPPLPTSSGTLETQEIPTEEPDLSMGPYDVAVIPPGALPEPDPAKIWRFVDTDVLPMQILGVVKDPRDVPLERFLYFNTPWKSSAKQGVASGVLEHWDASLIRQRFEDDAYMAVAVYVRMGGAVEVEDPVYVVDPHTDPWGSKDIFYPWDGFAIVDDQSDLRLPCVPQQFEDPGKEYEIPRTGEKFDPETYLPPKPWYPEVSPEIDVGEIREGWILCLAPEGPAEELRIVKLIRDGPELEHSREIIAWSKLDQSLMGDWVLFEHAQVIGWQKFDLKTAWAFDELPEYYPIIPDEPDPDSPPIYEGPVWISVAMGRTFDYEDSFNDGIQKLRLNIQFYFDGIEELLKEWDRVALKETFDLDVYADPSLALTYDYLGSKFDIQFRARDFWLLITELPDDVETVWVKMTERDGPEEWRAVDPMWKVDLSESTEEVTRTDDICEQTECVDLRRHYTIRNFGGVVEEPYVKEEGESLIVPFGEEAMGVRFVSATITDQPMLFSGTSPLITKYPSSAYNDRMMIVEVESKYGTLGRMNWGRKWDVLCLGEGPIEILGDLEPMRLHGTLEGDFSFSGPLATDFRAAAGHAVLIGDIKGTCPLEDILVFPLFTGPAWRVKSEPSGNASAMQNEDDQAHDYRQEPMTVAMSVGAPGPELSVGERFNLSFPYKPSGVRDYLARNIADDVYEWPEMNYLNEVVEHYGTKLKIVDYRLVPGDIIATVYYPNYTEPYIAPYGIDWVEIPPQTSLLMVKFEVDPEFVRDAVSGYCENEEEGIKSELRNTNLRVAYPGIGETSILDTRTDPGDPIFVYGEFASPISSCMLTGWHYAFIANLDPDTEKIWVMHVPESDPRDMIIWSLTDRVE